MPYKDPKKNLERIKNWKLRNPEKLREYDRVHQIKVKRQCIDHYGGVCACCGEQELSFLTLDHIHNDGAEHRKAIDLGGSGLHFYRWLISNNFQTEYELQVLCWNCQWGKRLCGVCPHQEVGHVQ